MNDVAQEKTLNYDRDILCEYDEKNNSQVSLGVENDHEYKINIFECDNMLITGASGAGKSAFVKNLIHNLISFKHPIDSFQFAIFDSSGYEYSSLLNSSYLWADIATSKAEGEELIDCVYTESFNRQDDPYNSNLYFILDDYSPLSARSSNKKKLLQILSSGRKTKIHCIIVTPVPSAQIIPTELKTMIKHKIVFRTDTGNISRMVLPSGDAALLENNELIYANQSDTVRLKKEEYNEAVIDASFKISAPSTFHSKYSLYTDAINIFTSGSSPKSDTAELMDIDFGSMPGYTIANCLRQIIEKNKADIASVMQQNNWDYHKAKRALDILEHIGIIGPKNSLGNRIILISEENNVRNNILQALENHKTLADILSTNKIDLYKKAIKQKNINAPTLHKLPIFETLPKREIDIIDTTKPVTKSAIVPNRKILTKQPEIAGNDCDISVSDSRYINLSRHYEFYGKGVTASFQIPADRIQNIQIKKISSSPHIKIIMDGKVEATYPANESDPLLRKAYKTISDSISDGIIIIPFSKDKTALFSVFSQQIANDLNISLEEI